MPVPRSQRSRPHRSVVRRTSRLLVFLLVLGIPTPAVLPGAAASTSVAGQCQVAAHRGDHTHYTENGLGAFRRAVTVGAEWLEADARVTSDQQVMLMHDETVDRTTNGTGAVSAMTATQVHGLRLNDGIYSPPYAFQVLNMAATYKRKVLLELKAMGTSTSYLRLANSIRAAGVDRVTIQSFSATLLSRIRAVLPEVKTAITSVEALPAATVRANGGIVVEQSAITDSWLATMAGLPVYAWVVDSTVGWERLSTHVDAIITNNPAGYIAARAALCGTSP
jgi:glycerophosphoryl diester phosphodiesterase